MVFFYVKALMIYYGLEGKASQKLNVNASDVEYS
jgi:hypothetical protein